MRKEKQRYAEDVLGRGRGRGRGDAGESQRKTNEIEPWLDSGGGDVWGRRVGKVTEREERLRVKVRDFF
jgi:hypothetical protein